MSKTIKDLTFTLESQNEVTMITNNFLNITINSLFFFSKLIHLKNLVHEAWSGIDVQLKRRYDLISNLMATVQGYSQHEKQTFENVFRPVLDIVADQFEKIGFRFADRAIHVEIDEARVCDIIPAEIFHEELRNLACDIAADRKPAFQGDGAIGQVDGALPGQ